MRRSYTVVRRESEVGERHTVSPEGCENLFRGRCPVSPRCPLVAHCVRLTRPACSVRLASALSAVYTLRTVRHVAPFKVPGYITPSEPRANYLIALRALYAATWYTLLDCQRTVPSSYLIAGCPT